MTGTRKGKPMKAKRLGALFSMIFGGMLVLGGFPASALAGDAEGTGPSVGAELATGHVPVWRVPFMKSQTGGTINSATVISLSNQGTATCSTSVDFFFGGGLLACTTTLSIGPGQTLEHCSRSIPLEIVSCNSTCSPALTLNEGHAVVGTTSACKSKLAVYPRLYYTGPSDTAVQAVADVKLVKTGKSNTGD